MEGINSRMDGLQAAILSVKLKYIHEWNQKRLKHAMKYNELLSNIDGIVIPKIHPDARHVFHLYVIRSGKREEIQKHLKDNGISTGIHYPTPLPFLKAYAYLEHVPDDFPIAYRYQNEILSLPMYPELTAEMIDHTVGQIKECVG